MLVGLIFRGVAFEFRFKANERERPVWDLAFIGGSMVAAFFQGVSLGALPAGDPGVRAQLCRRSARLARAVPAGGRRRRVIAYALLGATWLVMKTEGDLQKRMIRLAGP
jgi:cytochrome d ubiquinol oxidase subunit II